MVKLCRKLKWLVFFWDTMYAGDMMGCGILFPRHYRREWDDDIDDGAGAAVGRDDQAVNGQADVDVDAELGAGDAGFSSSDSEDEQWWERPNPENGTKVQVKVKGRVELLMVHHLTATGRHLPYGITQCYLPPDTSKCAPP